MENQGAECLYMVIMMATGEGEARALFGESSIGDTDGDGALRVRRWLGTPNQFPALGTRIRITNSTRCESTGRSWQ